MGRKKVEKSTTFICKVCNSSNIRNKFVQSLNICRKCYIVDYREKTKDIRKEKSKIYREDNRELLRLKNQEYHSKNILKDKIYRDSHKKEKFISNKKFYSSTRGILSQIGASAKNRKLLFILTYEYFNQWYTNQNQICHYCRRTLEQCTNGGNPTRLTIDRKDNNLGYIEGNLALSCRFCNEVKGNKFTEKEMIEIGRIIRKKFKNED